MLSICTNHPCTLCDTYDHYSHHYPQIPKYLYALEILHQLYYFICQKDPTLMVEDPAIKHDKSSQANHQLIIEIPPPEVKISENTMKILYLSTSMGSKLSRTFLSLQVYIIASPTCPMYLQSQHQWTPHPLVFHLPPWM
jgi:hypothetical protein